MVAGFKPTGKLDTIFEVCSDRAKLRCSCERTIIDMVMKDNHSVCVRYHITFSTGRFTLFN